MKDCSGIYDRNEAVDKPSYREFIRKAEAVLEKGKRASDELAIHWEKLSAEFEDCKQRGIPEDDAALHAILRVCVCVPTMMPLATVAMEACIKDISSQLLGLSLKAEFLGVKSVLKQNAATVSKMMVKNATAVAKGFAKGAAIGLNVALQVYDIYELFKELDTEHPAATAIGKIISQLEGKLGGAKELREAVNAVQRAHQRATRTRATTAQNGRTAQSQSTKNADKNKPGKNAAECDMGDGAEDEDRKRRPNRRTCENPLSEAEANELIRLLRELVREIQALSEDQRNSKDGLRTLLDRLTEILRKMCKAGFVASIDPKTRNLRLSAKINGRVLSYEISREGFHLCGLDPSDMENVFSTVLFGGSSEHIFCNEEGAVYHICAVEEENQHIRYVGTQATRSSIYVCWEDRIWSSRLQESTPSQTIQILGAQEPGKLCSRTHLEDAEQNPSQLVKTKIGSMEKALSEYISCLEELISELRQLRRTVVNFKDKCDCAKAVGTTVSTGGTALAIGSVLFAIPTGGLSLFVTAAAIETTVAGAVTNGITDSINHSETKEFIRKAEAVLEKGKRASDELAIHWEKLSAEFEDCKQRGIPEDDAALHAILRVCVCVPTMLPLATVAMEACIKDISSQLLGLSLKAEFLGVKSVLKQNAATVSKMMVKNATAVAKGFAKGAAIGLNFALQVYDIYELFKELDIEHPAATAIGNIVSQLEGKLGEARELREAVNAVQQAHQRATRTRATTARNGRTAQSQSTKDDDKNTPGENAGECDMGDGAEDEDPKRRPNRRTCENPLSEAEANELIRLLRELVREIQALSEDQRNSKDGLQTLLDRFTEILRKMCKAGFVASIDPKTRNLRLSAKINDRLLSYEISREGFHLCGLDPSDMENVFSTVLFGGSSEHIFCNECEDMVYENSGGIFEILQLQDTPEILCVVLCPCQYYLIDANIYEVFKLRTESPPVLLLFAISESTICFYGVGMLLGGWIHQIGGVIDGLEMVIESEILTQNPVLLLHAPNVERPSCYHSRAVLTAFGKVRWLHSNTEPVLTAFLVPYLFHL
nr:unnamed protein product [Spirometra erinaceieuropaei]